MANFDNRIEQLEQSAQKLRTDYEDARDFTAEVLAKAEALGITAVGIGATDESTQARPWPAPSGHDLFARGHQKYKRSDGTYGEGGCLVWRLAEEAGIYAGCGNSEQAQISYAAQAKLVDGIYKLEDGRWERQ